MKVFTCLSRNNSIVYENTHKSSSLISRFNFKHKKRRSGPYFKRPTSPPRSDADKENVAPAICSFQTYREVCSNDDTPPRRVLKENSANAKNTRRGNPLPPIPSKSGLHECDSDYLPLSHVCSPLRNDSSQDTTIISVGVYDLPSSPARDQSTVDSRDCLYAKIRGRNKVSSATITSSTVASHPHDEAFVQSTGSLPHRTYSNVAVSTDSLLSDVYHNITDTLASNPYNSIDTTSQYNNTSHPYNNTSSQYTASQYTTSQYTTSQCESSQYTATTQHDTSLGHNSLDSLSISDGNNSEEVSSQGISQGEDDVDYYSEHDYYNVSKLQRFKTNVIESADPYDTVEEEENKSVIDIENVSPSSASEFLGCMSFGVQSLLQKDLDGWYYLLTEEVGRKKHLQAHTKPKTVLTARSHQNIPHINKAVEGLERIVITVQRGKNSFGFSFIDEFPPKVGRVDRASPAEQAGVKKGDMVIRINGQNVSRSTCEGVAHLIKKMNPQSITLELQREHVVKTTVEISTSGHNPHHPSPYNKRGVGTSTDHLYESITDRSDHTKENWVSASQDGEFLTDDESAYYPQNHQQQAAITSTPRPFIRPTHKTVSSASLQSTNKHEFIHRLMSLELDYIDFMHYGIERYSRPLRHCIVSAHQHMIIFQNVEKLVTISEYHIKQMQDNTSSVDSDTEDSQSGESSMFPNSVALIYQSKVHMLCQAYESYANGLANSNTLLKELRKNRDFMSFVKEPASEDGQSLNQPTISAFINRPVQHIQELCVVLSEIFAATPLHSPDFATLQQIVIKLSQCITNITCLSSAGRVQSLDSLASSQGRTSSQAASSSKGSMASLSSSSSADPDSRPLLPNATASVRSLDRDVLRIQEKLALAPNIPAFQLCQESRHLIYQGNIYRCNKGSWFKSQLILFSDLILVVDEEADGTLLVATNPVYVQEISGIEINRKYASEFVLHLYPATSSTLPRKQSLTASSAADNARAIMLRAPSAQEKYVWQSLLEQRVAAVNGNKLKHYGSMRDISNFKTSIIL